MPSRTASPSSRSRPPTPHALARFYVDGLGLEVLAREDDRIWLAAGEHARLGLWTAGREGVRRRGRPPRPLRVLRRARAARRARRAAARARRRGPRPGRARRRRPLALRRGPRGQHRRGVGLLRARSGRRGARGLSTVLSVPPGKRMEVEVEGRTLSLSNLDKVFYPGDRLHQGPGDRLLHADRAGAAAAPARPPPDAQALSRTASRAQFFYEKQCPGHRPDWVRTAGVLVAPQRARDRLLHGRRPRHDRVAGQPRRPRDAHAARVRRQTPQAPTMLAFDLDPGPPATIVECAEVACRLRDAFDHFGLVAFPKTSGSKGMQLYVPLNTPTTYDATKPFAQGVAQVLERRHPELVVSEMRKDLRPGQGVHRLEPERRAQDDGLRLLAARARAARPSRRRSRGTRSRRVLRVARSRRPRVHERRGARRASPSTATCFAPGARARAGAARVRRLLLTGAAGRIAAAVRPVLRELADEVVLTDRVELARARARRALRARRAGRSRPVGGARGRAATRSLHLGAVPDEAAVRRARRARTCTARSTSTRRRGAPACAASSSASSGRATGFYRVGERLDGERDAAARRALRRDQGVLGGARPDVRGQVRARGGRAADRHVRGAPADDARPLDLAQPRRRAAGSCAPR